MMLLISDGSRDRRFKVPVIAAILWIGSFESKILGTTITD